MLSERQWSLLGVARLFLGVLATMCFAMGVGGLVPGMLKSLPEAQRNFWGMAVAAVAFQGATFFWIWHFLHEEKITWAQTFGLKNPGRNRAVVIGLIGGVAVVPIAIGLQLVSESVMNFFHLMPASQALVKELQGNELGLGQRAFFCVLAVVIAPMMEEALFRGLMYPSIKRLGRPKLALWGSSVLFGLSHANMVTFLPLTLLAVFLVFLYEETDNLLAPIMAHGAFNAANFVMVHMST